MAAPYKPELFNKESVLDFYDGAKGVTYKIYGGTSPRPEYCRYLYDGKEKELGLQELDRALTGLQNNLDNTNPYLLQVFSNAKKTKDGEITSATTQIVFQLNKPERFTPYYPSGMAGIQQNSDPEMKSILKQMLETQNLIISKLSAVEAEDEDEDKKDKGFLGGLLENEQMKDLLAVGIGALVSRFTNKQPTALAGIPDNEQITKAQTALQLLAKRDEKFGDHLLYLANIDESKYNMLLSLMN